jgi:hypothetical protein
MFMQLALHVDAMTILLLMFIIIPTYAQISSVNLYYIAPTCFIVNTPSSGSLQFC